MSAAITVAALRACLEVRRQIIRPHPSVGRVRRIAALSDGEFLVWIES